MFYEKLDELHEAGTKGDDKAILSIGYFAKICDEHKEHSGFLQDLLKKNKFTYLNKVIEKLNYKHPTGIVLECQEQGKELWELFLEEHIDIL